MENEEVHIKNPDSEDFTIVSALHTGTPTHYTIKGLQIAKFPKVIAEHIKEQLADKIWQKRGLKNYPHSIKAILRELEVKV